MCLRSAGLTSESAKSGAASAVLDREDAEDRVTQYCDPIDAEIDSDGLQVGSQNIEDLRRHIDWSRHLSRGSSVAFPEYGMVLGTPVILHGKGITQVHF